MKRHKKKALVTDVILVGPAASGKSSLCERYFYETFSGNSKSTIGLDFFAQTVETDFGDLQLKLVDSAGSEDFWYLAKRKVKEADLTVLVIDPSDKDTLSRLPKWVKRTSATQVVFLALTKSDLLGVNNRSVPHTLKCIGKQTFVTSAKTGEGVQELFTAIINEAATIASDKERYIETFDVEDVEEELLLKYHEPRICDCCCIQ
jgi:small GTP-binding protein